MSNSRQRAGKPIRVKPSGVVGDKISTLRSRDHNITTWSLHYDALHFSSKSEDDEGELEKELTDEEKAELKELEARAESGDHSDRLLYAAKMEQWDTVRTLLLSSRHFNFSLADKVDDISLI